MSEVTKELIKELREKSGAGLIDCKNALKETNGDVEGAIKYLREKGLAQAAKKASRTASDGKVNLALSDDGKFAMILELNCETDFVTKTDDFQNMLKTLTELAMEKRPANLDELNELTITQENNSKVKDWISEKIAIIGENIVLRRYDCIKASDKSTVAIYNHGDGKIGVLLEAEAGNSANFSKPEFADFMKDISMHIAAAAPQYLDSSRVDVAELEKEKDIYRKQILDQGKPENIVDKIVEGKIKKYYEEVCLLDQEHIRENKVKVSEVINIFSKKIGDSVRLLDFKRFALGA